MAFADSFAQCMNQAGVHMDASAVTDQQHFQQSINYLKEWFHGLDQTTQEALDAATTNDRASYLLAEAQVAPGIPDMLHQFDQATGWPLSTLIQWSEHCISQAAGGGQAAAAHQ